MNEIFHFSDDDDSDDDNYDIKSCRKCSKMNNEGNKNKVCSRCKKVSYCSVECQRADWSKHKKACKYLQFEGKFVKKVNECYHSDTTQQTLEEIKRTSDPQAIRAMGMDLDALNTADGQAKLQDLSESMSASDQLDSLLNKYQGVEPQKLAKNLLKAIHDNHDRRAFHMEVYQYMMRTPKVWDACFETEKSMDRFFFVLQIAIKNDIREFKSLPDSVSDRIIPSPSAYIIKNLYFTPLVRQEMTRSQFYAEYRKHARAGFQLLQPVAAKREPERVSWYYKTCWKEHVELSLAMFTAYQKGITNLMEDIVIYWKDTVLSLVNPERARELFQSSLTLYNKPFHDPTSPFMVALIEMLLVRGPGVEQFKHWVYTVAAMLIFHARGIQDENLISSSLLPLALIDRLGQMRLHFLIHISLKYFVEIMTDARSTAPDTLDTLDAPRLLEPMYERYYAQVPQMKDFL